MQLELSLQRLSLATANRSTARARSIFVNVGVANSSAATFINGGSLPPLNVWPARLGVGGNETRSHQLGNGERSRHFVFVG